MANYADKNHVPVKIIDANGAENDATHPLYVSGTVTATDLDLRNLVAATDSVTTTPNTAAVVTGCTIASGAATSNAVDVGSNALAAIVVPAAFTGTKLTFQTAPTSGGTYQNVYDDTGGEVSVTVAQGRTVVIDAALTKLAALRFIKLRSGTAATITPEGAERAITLITK